MSNVYLPTVFAIANLDKSFERIVEVFDNEYVDPDKSFERVTEVFDNTPIKSIHELNELNKKYDCTMSMKVEYKTLKNYLFVE